MEPSDQRRLRIAIATAGRFHVLDLARELDALGHEVSFYSYVPKKRAVNFGLPRNCHVSLLPSVFPLVAWERSLSRVAPGVRERLMFQALNKAVISRLRPCDVFVFMSGIYLEAARFAKRRFGARLWLERGSEHILSQDEVLARAQAERPTPLVIKRELEGYAIADRIVVPSLHAQQSFHRESGAPDKIFRNPYGVDISMFAPVLQAPPEKPFKLIYAGTWSRQKGCDTIVAAVGKLPDVRFVHVGSVGDYPLPAGHQFQHVDAVPQWELPKFYAAADAFVLASRHEGFGMVLAQALAAGLQVIASDRTGAGDLKRNAALTERIAVFPAGNADALADAVVEMQQRLGATGCLPPLQDCDREALSWRTYGQRYHGELLKDIA